MIKEDKIVIGTKVMVNTYEYGVTQAVIKNFRNLMNGSTKYELTVDVYSDEDGFLSTEEILQDNVFNYVPFRIGDNVYHPVYGMCIVDSYDYKSLFDSDILIVIRQGDNTEHFSTAEYLSFKPWGERSSVRGMKLGVYMDESFRTYIFDGENWAVRCGPGFDTVSRNNVPATLAYLGDKTTFDFYKYDYQFE